ncbi:hypothetical protein BGW36DRAFT_427589 [Talaromyces proteolyticus]|uniref:Uncharacterized protein n=1 Tax=Talaromyces proteolyticus TaxID=1131652 RepID=A0AAD4KS77_9EURO|nr:uncharacterized protein BGW36DRAFT_427589 [Talaromyces proteolyticus]KAH8697633.1 hypothetical protein BGW36DRAFT_427589 [Talaromyces proteolyticus]
MGPPHPSSLQVRASWDGDIRHAACIYMIVEVETKPNSRLTLLSGVKNTGLSHSMLWEIAVTHDTGDLPPSPPRKLFPSIKNHRDEDNGEATSDHLSSSPPVESSNDKIQPICNDNAGVSEYRVQEKAEEASITGPSLSHKSSSILKKDGDISQETSTSISMVNAPGEPDLGDSLVDLLPSPTPSSRDLMPWASATDIASRLETEEDAGAESDCLSVASEFIRSSSKEDPDIFCENGELVFNCPSFAKERIYRAEIIFLKHIREGRDKWLSLNLSPMIMACPDIQGTFVFDGPSGYNFEFASDILKAQTSNGHLEYKFTPREWLLTPFRLCKDETLSKDTDPFSKDFASAHEEDKQDTDNISPSVLETGPKKRSKRGRPEFKWLSEEEIRQMKTDILKWFFTPLHWVFVAIYIVSFGIPGVVSGPANTWWTIHEIPELARNFSMQGYSMLQMKFCSCPSADRSHHNLHDNWPSYDFSSLIKQSTTSTATKSSEALSTNDGFPLVSRNNLSLLGISTTNQYTRSIRLSDGEILATEGPSIGEELFPTEIFSAIEFSALTIDFQSEKDEVSSSNISSTGIVATLEATVFFPPHIPMRET